MNYNNVKLSFPLTAPTSRKNYSRNIPSPPKPPSNLNHEFILDLIKKDNPVILEVGAADGNDSLTLLNNYKNIKLYCFDADPRSIHIHKKYINDKRCTLTECVVSNIDGEIIFNLGNQGSSCKKLYRHQTWHQGNSDRYELFKEATDIYNERFNIQSNTPTENGWYFSSSISKSIEGSAILQKHQIKTKSITLDTFCKQNNINHIDFLWTDVEAAEKVVVEGAVETLKFTNYLMLEFGLKYLFYGAMDKDETIEFMKKYNYSPIQIIENNIIFKNLLYFKE